MGASEYIKRLRKEMDIPETDDEILTRAEEKQYQREVEARRKRFEEAGTEARYVELYNRDPWTDEWLGDGPEPPMPYLEDDLSSKKQAKAIEARKEHDRAEWKKKYSRPDKELKFNQVKETKAVKKARKKAKKAQEKKYNKAERLRVYKIANWYMQEVLDERTRMHMAGQFVDDFEGMVDHVYEVAMAWITNFTYDGKRGTSLEDAQDEIFHQEEEDSEVVEDVGGMKFKRRDVAEAHRKWQNTDIYENRMPSIPDKYWDEFEKWCEDHPISEFEKKAKKLGNRISAMGLRRNKFLKSINKSNKKFRKNIMLHDPITGASFVSEKKMKEHFERQRKIIEKHNEEFAKMVEGMVERGELSKDYAKEWLGNTKEAVERIDKRFKDTRKRVTQSQRVIDEQRKRDDKVNKDRVAWFKSFGHTIDPHGKSSYIIRAGDEELTLTVIPGTKGGRDLYKLDRPGHSTAYSEKLESFYH